MADRDLSRYRIMASYVLTHYIYFTNVVSFCGTTIYLGIKCSIYTLLSTESNFYGIETVKVYSVYGPLYFLYTFYLTQLKFEIEISGRGVYMLNL